MKKFNFLYAGSLLACSIAFMISCSKKQAEVPGPVKADIDLSIWQLQEPDGKLIDNLVLDTGYHDKYFYDSTDGSKVFYAPLKGFHFENSKYTRCELKQTSYWSLTGTHTLSATLKVVTVQHKVCVGQIHLGYGTPASTKPLCELYCDSIGDISLGIERLDTVGQESYSLGKISLGTRFSYSIKARYSTDTVPTITVTINNSSRSVPFNPFFNNYSQFFKAGAYNQSPDSIGYSLIQFYSLNIK